MFVAPDPSLGVFGRIQEGLEFGWLPSTSYGGEVLVTPKDRLDNYFLGPVLVSRIAFCPCNRTQSRAVTGLLSGHTTLRRHLHLTGLSDNPLCSSCGAEDATSAHTLCQWETWASLRHIYLGSLFLEAEDIKSIILRAIWNFSKATWLH